MILNALSVINMVATASEESGVELYYIVMLCLLPVIVLMLLAGVAVKINFNRYSKFAPLSGLTGAECARKILDANGLIATGIKPCKGTLTDYYDSHTDTVYLSEMVYNVSSISALGVAAHEVGHAIQHNDDYLFVKIRTALVPVCNFTSRYSLPLIIVGFVLEMFMGITPLTTLLIFVGIAFYGVYTLFTLITLPVEFNASRRARGQLLELNIIDERENYKIKKVLYAAANTYVMSFALSLLYLLRYLAIFASSSRRKN